MKRITRVLIIAAILSAAGVSPAQAGIIVDHQPSGIGGPPGDTGWNDIFGEYYWQQAADDFQLGSSSSVSRVVWHGFYGDSFFPLPPPTPPPGAERLRMRFYDSRAGDGLPGLVVYEESFLNPLRMATGRTIYTGETAHPEYRFQAELLAPLELQAGTRYWIEIVQVDSLNSLFRWEYSPGDGSAYSLINEHVPDWVRVPEASNLSFQLINIPEPAPFALLGLLVAGLILPRGRREARRHCKTSTS